MVKALIVGCGMSAASISYYFCRIPNHLKNGITVQIVEASDMISGRMRSHSHSINDNLLKTDLGAQYLTKYQSGLDDIFKYLEDEGIICRFDARNGIIQGIREKYSILPHYSAPKGMDHLIKDLIESSEVRVRLNTKVTSIDLLPDTVQVLLQSTDSASVYQENYDIVVTTLPSPSLLEIQGNFLESPVSEESSRSTIRSRLEEVHYSKRFALSLYCSLPNSLFSESIQKLPFKAQYIYDKAIIRYLSFEYWKELPNELFLLPSTRDQDNTYFSVLIHTTVPFAESMANRGIEIKNEATQQEITDNIVEELEQLHPSIPWKSSIQSHYLHYWDNSQITSTFPKEKDSFWALRSSGGSDPKRGQLIISGEMFTESVFEGCVRSGKATAEYLQQLLVS